MREYVYVAIMAFFVNNAGPYWGYYASSGSGTAATNPPYTEPEGTEVSIPETTHKYVVSLKVLSPTKKKTSRFSH